MLEVEDITLAFADGTNASTVAFHSFLLTVMTVMLLKCNLER